MGWQGTGAVGRWLLAGALLLGLLVVGVSGVAAQGLLGDEQTDTDELGVENESDERSEHVSNGSGEGASAAHSVAEANPPTVAEVKIPDERNHTAEREYRAPGGFAAPPQGGGRISAEYPPGILPEPYAGDSREEVVPDGFYPETPESTVVRLRIEDSELQFSATCSGTMITDYHVLTAGHCLYGEDDYGGWADEVTVYPGTYDDNGPVFPYHEAEAEKLRVTSEYESIGSDFHDMGLVTLDRPIGEYTGYMGYEEGGYTGGDEFYSWGMIATGYPTWSENANGPAAMMEGFGPTSGTSGGPLGYFHDINIDISGGQSGGPVYHTVDTSVGMVVSVIAKADTSDYEDREHNYGTRIGPGKSDFISDAISSDSRPGDVVAFTDTASLYYWDGTAELDKNTIMSGETLSMTSEVRNVGTAGGVVDVEYYLSADDSCSPADDYTLDTADSSVPALQFEVMTGDGTVDLSAGEYHAYRIVEDGDCVFYDETVEVVEPSPDFDVTLTSTDITGSTLEVAYEVTNVGTASGTQNVTSEADYSEFDTQEFTLDVDETASGTANYSIQNGDGDIWVFICSNNGCDYELVSVAPPDLELTIEGTNSPVTAGEEFTVTATATNAGDEPTDESVKLTGPDGKLTDLEEVEIGSNEQQELTLGWDTDADDTGNTTVTLESETAETKTVPVTVVESGSLNLSVVGTNSPVRLGEILRVTVNATNTGTAPVNEAVRLFVSGTSAEYTYVDIPAGETENLVLRTTITDKNSLGQLAFSVDSESAQRETAQVAVTLPPLPGHDSPPQDLDDDGLYEDINGNGAFRMFDVQVFFENLETDPVQNHVWAYDFNQDGQVNLLDIQAMFNKL